MPPTPRRFDLIVFDWDGTLMDSAACIASSLRAACGDLGFTVPTDRDARYIIGLGLHDALAHVLPGVPQQHYPAVVERYRHHFTRQDGGTTLFPGVAELLTELRASGHLLAVATGKSRRGLDRALSATGLTGLFSATRCGEEGMPKPHPQMLNWLMHELRAPTVRTLMIGDTTHDLAMARSAKVPAIAMAHGAHSAIELLELEPFACLQNCAELRAWLQEHA
jgi:phosphoglycolate phosphatase